MLSKQLKINYQHFLYTKIRFKPFNCDANFNNMKFGNLLITLTSLDLHYAPCLSDNMPIEHCKQIFPWMKIIKNIYLHVVEEETVNSSYSQNIIIVVLFTVSKAIIRSWIILPLKRSEINHLLKNITNYRPVITYISSIHLEYDSIIWSIKIAYLISITKWFQE